MKDHNTLEHVNSKCHAKCGYCAYCQGMEIGDTVSRRGDNGRQYDYEIEDIDPDGSCISIINEDAFPTWAYIMADDCVYNENKEADE